MNDSFLGGVIEGFYGRPWTHAQRLTVVDQLADWGLNTYFYAPKDDLKHRARWRLEYDDVELGQLAEIAARCRQREIRFLYGISPGLDIRFSDPGELQILLERIRQMRSIDVRDFALLFDDLPGEITPADRARFDSVAAAQASVTNLVFDWLWQQDSESRLLFCPTPYCDRMDQKQLGGTDYLDQIGNALKQDIDVFWTGPEIISAEIPVDSIRRLTQRIGRPPVIWDNLHANDYDQRRLYCGPYSRSPELRQAVRGILLNPNNEFVVNHVPLQTLGRYLVDDRYDPRAAFLAAIADWSSHYQTIADPVSIDDVVLLADCHYLPFQHGDQARQLDRLVEVLLRQQPDSWGDALEQFEVFHRRVVRLFEQLAQLNDRELFYAWSRRIWDLREELDLISGFAKSKQSGRLVENGFLSDTHFAKIYRGGFVADLQRRLKLGETGRFEAV